jgi:hypothetical protein
MLVESGFALETIPYHRPERAGGVSKNDLLSLLTFSISGLAGSSKGLLRLPLYVSLLVGFTATLTMLWGLASAIWGHSAWHILGLALGQGAFALVCFFLGLMGEHIRVISEVVRNTPLVVERERINFLPRPKDQAHEA